MGQISTEYSKWMWSMSAESVYEQTYLFSHSQAGFNGFFCFTAEFFWVIGGLKVVELEM